MLAGGAAKCCSQFMDPSQRRMAVRSFTVGAGGAIVAMLLFGVDLAGLYSSREVPVPAAPPISAAVLVPVPAPVRIPEPILVPVPVAPAVPVAPPRPPVAPPPKQSSRPPRPRQPVLPTAPEAPAAPVKVVLVIDESGSMQNMLQGGGRAAMAELRDAIHALLDRDANVRYGLVTFATHVIAELPVEDAPGTERVRAAFDAPSTCPYGTACMTATWEALHRATALLEAAPGARGGTIILFTDGVPDSGSVGVPDGMARAQAAAAEAWAAGITIYTVHVNDFPVGMAMQQFRDFLISISGTPGHRGDPSYYRVAASRAELDAVVSSITPVP
jgi:hypothetical protein